MDGDRDRLGDNAAMGIIDGRRIGQRQYLADRQEIERAVGDAVGPGRRAVVDVAWCLHHCQRHFHRRHSRLLLRVERQRMPTGIGVGKRGESRARNRAVGQVNVGKADLAGHGIERRRSGRVRLGGIRPLDEGVARRSDGRDIVGAADGDVGAVDRHRDRRGDDSAMAVIDLRHVVECELLAVGDEIKGRVGEAVAPGRRAVVGIAGCLHHGQRHLDGQDRRQLRRRQRRRDVVALRIEIAEWIGGRDRRADDRPVGQIDVGKGNGAGRRIGRRIAGAKQFRDRAAARGDGRLVVGSGNGNRKRLDRGLVVRREIIIDLREIGQRQRLADGQEVERTVGDVVGPGRHTVVDAGGVLHHHQRHFDRMNRRQLLRGQRRRDIGMLRVLEGEGSKRGFDGRNVAGVNVGIGDRTGHGVDGGAAGGVGAFGKGRAVGDDVRRTGNMVAPAGGRTAGRGRGLVRHVGRVHGDRDYIAIGELDEHRFGNDRIGKVGGSLGVGVVEVAELQRKDVGDDFLRIGRQLRRRQEVDPALAVDDRRGAGLIDGRNRRQCQLVEQDIGAGGTVRLDQHLEFGGRRAAGGRHREIDLDQHRGAANAHGRDGGVDLHVAMLGGSAGDERDRTLHQTEQRLVVRPVGVVDHFVQHHLGVRRQAEHGAVDEGNAESRIGSGLDDVAFVDVVALVQDHRNAVADRGCAARELGDMADHRWRNAGAAVGLRELGVSGQCVDEVAGEMGAIG